MINRILDYDIRFDLESVADGVYSNDQPYVPLSYVLVRAAHLFLKLSIPLIPSTVAIVPCILG